MSYTQEMKSELNFWRSLEEYSWKVMGRSPLPWPWVGVGVVAIVLCLSLLNVKNSMIGVRDVDEAIELAAKRGDYKVARMLFDSSTNTASETVVLGVKTELEDIVYPERIVEKQIIELENKLEKYPGNREIYHSLSTLYAQVGKQETANAYQEMARVLDPNKVNF